ncbi:MAG: ABC transporter substrate-binding protein [Xanthobacteraceae bacterium]|nr:ABC transporter substrate-binding protein [Xanthobacteraceae bacterium]
MSKLKLSFCTGPYDRMSAIFDGTVAIDGVELDARPVQQPMEIFSRMLRNDEFDVCEMSLAHCFFLRQRGLARFVSVPVFPSKMFRHSFIFVNRNAVATPADLKGRRIGVQGFQMTAAVWIRGLLREDYGVSLDDVQWIEGGVNEKGVAGGDATSFHPHGLAIRSAGPDKTLSDMLARGEIDALIGAVTPASLYTSPDVVRLFPDYHAVERAYFEKTGVFPIMHGLVIREALYRDHRWIAGHVYKACESAKRIALDKMRFSASLQFMLPWLGEHLEEIQTVFGGDPWAYGIAANRKALENFSRYLVADGLLKAPMAPEEVFVPIDRVSALG